MASENQAHPSQCPFVTAEVVSSRSSFQLRSKIVVPSIFAESAKVGAFAMKRKVLAGKK